MMRPGLWLLGFVARALEPAERDVVLGDVAESGQGICPAIWDLLDLIVRRQVGLWALWRPWLALLGVSGIAGLQLSGIAFRLNVDLGQQLMAHHKYGVRFETGLTAGQDTAFLLCRALGLLVWSWASGFALGSLSGRAVWVTWSVFYLVVLDSTWGRFVLAGNIILRDAQPFRLLMGAALPLSMAALLFSVPAISGALMGLRRRVLPVRYAYLLGSAITVFTILTTWMTGWYETALETWSGGVWRGVSWPMRLLPFVLVSWPAVYLLAEAYRQHAKKEKLI